MCCLGINVLDELTCIIAGVPLCRIQGNPRRLQQYCGIFHIRSIHYVTMCLSCKNYCWWMMLEGMMWEDSQLPVQMGQLSLASGTLGFRNIRQTWDSKEYMIISEGTLHFWNSSKINPQLHSISNPVTIPAGNHFKQNAYLEPCSHMFHQGSGMG